MCVNRTKTQRELSRASTERDMRTVDLRSDTKTLPSTEMRVAIAEAELGDADEGEDPTVNRLEAMAAERLGKEDAVLVTSGTQGNMVAILCPVRPWRLRHRRSEHTHQLGRGGWTLSPRRCDHARPRKHP